MKTLTEKGDNMKCRRCADLKRVILHSGKEVDCPECNGAEGQHLAIVCNWLSTYMEAVTGEQS